MNAAQSGRSDLKLASLRRDKDLVLVARKAAFRIVTADPGLARNRALREELQVVFAGSDIEFLFKS
jgi:ATP-dependent DNA helicase RecG